MADTKPIILFHTEEFKFEKVKDEALGSDKVLISGNAQPLFEDSRNGVRYRAESVKKAYTSLSGVAFLFNHNTDKPLGHVVSAGLTATHVTYQADVDPEEKDYIRKVERGDVRHVSVGCMVENVVWNEDDQIYECDVKEYVELSAVPVPGFSNTSASKESALYLANALGDNAVLEKLKKEAEDPKDPEDKKDEEVCPTCGKDPCECDEEACKKKKASADEEDPEKDKTDEALGKEAEQTLEEKVTSLVSQMSDLFGKVETLVSSVSALESKIEVIQNEKDKEADKKPEETEDPAETDGEETDAEDETEDPKPEDKPEDKPKDEEKVDASKLNPDVSEKFESKKIIEKSVETEKLKNEALGLNENAGMKKEEAKIDESKKTIDVTKCRMKNIRY